MPFPGRTALVIILCAGAGIVGANAAPTISPQGIVNAASSSHVAAPVAAGSIVSIYGAGMASSPPGSGVKASAFPLPSNLGGTQVLMNGFAAPLYYANSAQINAQVPWEVAGASTLTVQVLYGGTTSNTVTVALAAIAPGVFSVVHALDYSPVSPARPAIAGDYLVVFCTGLGAVTNTPPTGSPAQSDPLSVAITTATITIAGLPANVAFAGLTPGLAGMYQINVQVPAAAASGNSVQLVMNDGDAPSIVSVPFPVVLPVTLATFPLPELFGVPWPDQPIEFRYDGGAPPPGTTRMLDLNGSEVPYQWVSSCSDATAVNGCILVRDRLPANSNSVWTLQSGVPPTATPVNAVRLAQAGSNWEITNGLTGVRIASSSANPAPWNLAPIQGIQLAGGVWTGRGGSPNLLYTERNAGASPACVGCALNTPAYSATSYAVSVIDSGPMKVVVKASYTFNRPNYSYGQTVINTAGAGHYTIIVTMYANSKSILIDEDSDMQFSWYVPLYAEVSPDQERHRGHDSLDTAGVSDPVCGYETPVNVTDASNGSPIVIAAPAAAKLSNGQPVLISGVQGNNAANGTWFAKTSGYAAGQFGLYLDANLTMPVTATGDYTAGGIVKPAYRGQAVNPISDAWMDLTYSSDRPASYGCSTKVYRKLVTNYPSADHSAGWYSMLYQSNGGSGDPVVGFYTGRFSQLSHSANGPSMPGVYTSNKHWITGAPAAGIQVDNLLRGPDASLSPLVHRNWGIWVSTQADVLPASSHQPIADEQNTLTGINLSRLYTYQLVYPDPPGGWQWQYLPAASANQLIAWVRDGTAVCGSVNCYYNLLKNSEGSGWGQALLTMWRGNSTAAVQTALNTGIQLAQRIVQTLAAGDNRFDGPLGYYQLGLQTSPETAVLNAVIMDANSTAAQKATAKAQLALFGNLLWDNDWWPINNNTGEGAGLANQVQQYLQYRTQSAAAAPSQPFLSSVLALAATNPMNDFAAYFSSTGAAAGSTHYQSAFFEPLILNYLNSSLNGTLSMSDPKWAAYANWELSIQTPPEPRFGNVRKGYSNGDGNTEADVRTGLLGTALYPVNPGLAGNLMWAWQQSNSATLLTEDAQFVTTLAVIDPTIPAVAPQLASINIPGYHSVERHNFATPNETALWFINGGFYSTGGHRHADDGQVSIYAHGAPLAIDWNANLYYPETPGRFMHNSVVFDSELSHLWSADNAAFSDAQTLFLNPVNTEFAAFGNSTTASATFATRDGTTWTRTARMLNFNPSYPIIYVTDAFSGPGAAAGKTLTWNLMAAGPVNTPSGPVTPIPRFSSGCQSPAGALPSTGTVFGLPAGLNQFSFTGAAWPKHDTGGIDWDLFTLSGTASQQFLIGNWGHGCEASREASEYKTANGTSFAEIQDILRVHDAGPFTTMILPYRKSESPARAVSQQSCGVQILQGTESSCFNDSAATYSNGDTAILTVFDASSQSAFGITVSGGPQEVITRDGQIAWTIGGIVPGMRTLSVGGEIHAWSYEGGAQTSPVTITFPDPTADR